MSGPEPAELWEEVVAWLRVADVDQRAAGACLKADPPLHEAVAFHCQQAAEKLLKGFLVLGCTDFAKTHNLKYLGGLVVVLFPSVGPLVGPMADWTHWGVAYRYPDDPGPEPAPSIDELQRALMLVRQLENVLRTFRPTEPESE